MYRLLSYLNKSINKFRERTLFQIVKMIKTFIKRYGSRNQILEKMASFWWEVNGFFNRMEQIPILLLSFLTVQITGILDNGSVEVLRERIICRRSLLSMKLSDKIHEIKQLFLNNKLAK